MFSLLLPHHCYTTRDYTSQKAKKMSIRRGKSEFIRTSTCPFTFLHPSRWPGTATYISREIATKTGELELVNFLLNQPAGSKASSCNLLRASARCRPGNTYCQGLRKHNPTLFTFCSSAGVSMSPFLVGSKRQIRQLKLSSTP